MAGVATPPLGSSQCSQYAAEGEAQAGHRLAGAPEQRVKRRHAERGGPVDEGDGGAGDDAGRQGPGHAHHQHQRRHQSAGRHTVRGMNPLK